MRDKLKEAIIKLFRKKTIRIKPKEGTIFNAVAFTLEQDRKDLIVSNLKKHNRND